PKRRYWTKGEVDEDAIDRDDVLSMGSARVVVPGTDVTLVTYGPLVATAIDAAAAAASDGDGVSVEVIDLRSLAPVDVDTVVASVAKTGRLVIAHEAQRTGGIGADLAAELTDRCFYHLEAAPQRVTGFDLPYPASRHEEHFLPDLDRLLDAVDRVMGRRPALYEGAML
ncbi:MAG: transketolase C-terminal domain-containing protein, partial [Microcella sp.]